MVERRPVLDWATDWDHLGPQYHEQAIEVWSDLRERSPIAHTDRFGRAWMPVRFEDIAAVAHDTTTFSSLEVNLFDVKPEDMLTLPPIMLDPPDHAAHRRLMLPRFTPAAVADLIPFTEALCHRLLDRITDTGGADAGIDYAQHVPVLITAKLLGLPDADADQFRAWIHAIVELGFTDPEASRRASREVLGYFNSQLEDRRERGGDDLTAWLAHAHLGDSPLPSRTQAAMLFLLLIGGIDTTWTALGAALYHFATHPEDQSRLRAEPGLLDSAIEEVLRFYAPVEIGRIVARDTELAGRSVAAGDHVWLSYPAANRDPEAFDEPDRFIIDRKQNRHLAFGVGVHRCLGSNLARMELQTCGAYLVRAHPRLRARPHPPRRLHPGRHRSRPPRHPRALLITPPWRRTGTARAAAPRATADATSSTAIALVDRLRRTRVMWSEHALALGPPTWRAHSRQARQRTWLTGLVVAWPIRYATTVDGARLAYQVVGDGPIDVVVSPPLAQNIELAWERPEYRRIFERFARFSRMVHFDKRGTGASDRTVPVPGLDQRVDDLRCVMDAAGVDRAVLHGLSEGGPTVVLFAATYPERVSGLLLHATAARFGAAHRTPEELERMRHGVDGWVRTWGTAETTMVARFAPSALVDASYMAWQPRYERQCASPSALRDLLDMIDAIDVTELLPQISVPTLVLHRRDDGVVPLEAARQLAEAIPGARLEVLPGRDHFAHIGDVDAWIDVIERHLTGAAPTSSRSVPRRRPGVEIRTLGGFSIWRDGAEVPLAEWGSRRARTLCKRLAAAEGRPVSRWQLIDTLWPDETGDDRLSARLSVQLSHVRRVLGGGVIADRDSIRLDLGELVLDIDAMRLDVAAGRLADAVARYHGEFLPDDLDAAWAENARDRARTTCLAALRSLIEQARAGGAPQDAVRWAQQLLGLDPYDREANGHLVRALDALGQPGEASRAYERYVDRMRQLGVTPEGFRDLTGPRR